MKKTLFAALVVALATVTLAAGQEYTKGRSQASFVKSKMIDGNAYVEFPAQIQSIGGGWSPVTIAVEHEVWLAVDAKVRTEVKQSDFQGLPSQGWTLTDTLYRGD